MAEILKSIRRTELKFDAAASRFLTRHLLLGWCVILAGIPLFVLLAVSACTAALILPFALLFGWL